MATVQYDAKTGNKLSAGASTTDALGNTYKQGQEFSTGSSAKNSGFTQIGNTNYRNSYLEQNPQLQTQPEQVDTAQPSPANVPVGQGVPGGNINQFDPNTGKPLALGQSVVSPTGETVTQGTPFKQAFQQTKLLGTPVAKTMGEAASTIQQTVPNESNLASPLTSIVDTDSNFDSIFTMFDDFYSPVKQKQSLLEEYKSMESSLGINAINAELLNSKRIIEGTEDDIRSEVQAVSGFATDSQVLALSNARNKSLVKNYNYLLEARDSAMTQLNTMMNLSIQDRQMAEKEFDTKMNFAFKVQEFKQKAVDNAKEGYNNVINTVGYKGLYDSLLKSGDKTAVGTVEKTLGLTSGQLATLASQRDLDRELKLAQISSANRANQPDEGTGTLTGKPQNATQSAANSYANRMAEANVAINNLGNKFTGKLSQLPAFNFMKSADRQVYEQSQKNFITAVLRRESGASIAPTEFDTARDIYFPKPGDTKDVVANKAKTRNTVINNFYREANVNRPVFSGDIIEANGKTYKVGADGETLEEI